MILEKDERYFYYRFMDLKPETLSEDEWFLKFNWNPQQIAGKKSDWKKIERPRPETIIFLAKKHAFTPEQLIYLQYGSAVAISATGGRAGKKASG